MPIKKSDNNTLPAGFSPDFLETIRNLIAYYVLRQQLVVLAMVERNPRGLDKSVRINIRPYLQVKYDRMLAIKRARDEERKADARVLSIWKNDWECFPHGIGCRLTHLHTGERIEWDGPDRFAFRIDWFLNHLVWRLKNEIDDPYVDKCDKWIKANEIAIKVVEKAIDCLIDLRIIIIRQDHTCKFADDFADEISSVVQLKDEVIDATLNSLLYYRQRQQIAIEAMVELRPDFIVQVAHDPYTMPDTAYRLESLYKHLDTLPESGSKIQTGKWRDGWIYDIRYTTCTLIHTTTDETIRWSTADPPTVDYHGFTQHLLWRFTSDSEDTDLKTIYQWLEQHGEGTFHAFGRLMRLIDQLISSKIIVLIHNEKGLLIKWNSQQKT